MNGRVSKIVKRAARIPALRTTERALKRAYVRTPSPQKHKRLGQLRAAVNDYYGKREDR